MICLEALKTLGPPSGGEGVACGSEVGWRVFSAAIRRRRHLWPFRTIVGGKGELYARFIP